jgi:acetoin utilization deacetylase AcuC-like enzyme
MFKVAWSKEYNHPLPPKHRFPMEKYDLLPSQLLLEGIIGEEDIFAPRKLTEKEVLAVHTREYWEKLRDLRLTKSEERRSGFPLSDSLVERELTINGGTLECTHFAMGNGVAFNIAGGTHHAYSDRAEGFCLLNDQAIAAQYLLDNGIVKKILIVDLDVHQGNGTAEIFTDSPPVFTFSMHGKRNYPMHKEASDLDIELEDAIGDEEYLKLLSEKLEQLIESHKPEFIFYQAGVDVLATDKLGRLGLSIAGCKRRDEHVLSLTKKYQIPVVITMGGGYSEDIRLIIEAHTNTFKVARDLYF